MGGHSCGSVHLPFRQHLLKDHMIVSYDNGLVKVWDIRINEAVISIKANGGQCRLESAIGFEHKYVASAGCDEAITIWDLRYNQALYHMSTGNNYIKQMVWHKPSGSLIGASDTRINNLMHGNSRDNEDEWPKD